MNTLSKQEAIGAPSSALADLSSLRGTTPFSRDHTRWLANTLRVLESVFGPRSRYYLTLKGLNWRFSGTSIITAAELLRHHPDDIKRSRDQDAYLSQLETAEGLLQAAMDELEMCSDMASIYEGKDSAPEASSIVKVINSIERKLRKVVRNTPEREIDVQDALETLLVAADIPYSREKVQFEYSSRSYRPDFTLDMIDLALEVKLCSSENRERKIVSEINDDILGYSTRYGNLLFVVYDLGSIRDVDRFLAAFNDQENVVVRVVKH